MYLILALCIINLNDRKEDKYEEEKNKKKDIPILWVDDSQYADLPVTKNPDNIITEEEQKQIDEILKKYKF